MIDKAAAIISLRPGALWAMDGNDVENITWLTEGVEPLTEAEVLAEMARLQAAADESAQEKEAARAASLAKLAALGLTPDDLAALGL